MGGTPSNIVDYDHYLWVLKTVEDVILAGGEIKKRYQWIGILKPCNQHFILTAFSGSWLSTLCEFDDLKAQAYYSLLLLGQAVFGLAGTILYLVAPAFIERSVSSKQYPVYIGQYE